MKISSLLIRTCRVVNSSRVNRRFLHEKSFNEFLPMATESVIRNQLTELSVPFTDGYACLHVKGCTCFKNQKGKAKAGDVYVNKRTGFFLCEQCKTTGDWDTYSTFLSQTKEHPYDLSDFKKTWKKYDEEAPGWQEITKTSIPFSSLDNVTYKNVLRDFNVPNCSKDISEKLQVRYSREKLQLIFPLVYSSSSPVIGYKTIDIDGHEVTYPKADCPGYLYHSIMHTSAAVITSNIHDFISLISEYPAGYDIICLQYGTSHLPQSTLPFLEKYNRIVLWLGEGTLDVTGNFAKKLGEKRCYVVRATDNQVSPLTAVTKNENVNEILATAKLTWHQFVTTFDSLRHDVLAELQDRNNAFGIPWTRFPELTKILKGHRRGELTILTGPTGVGKTTFLSEYSLDLAMQGVNTLWGSFELKNTRLARIMLTQFAESPLPKETEAFNKLCNKFEELPLYFLTFHGQQDLGTVMEAVHHCSYTYDIGHVIIDNVQFMIEVSNDTLNLDRFWKQDYMIQSFRQFASKFNCHVTLVMHPKKVEGLELSVNSIFGGVKASQEADNVLIMQVKDLQNFGKKKYLQVSKNRYAGDLGTFPLTFDKSTLSFSKPVVERTPLQTYSKKPEEEIWDEMHEEIMHKCYER